MTHDQNARQIIKDGIKPQYKLPPLDEFVVIHRHHEAEAWLDQDGIVWYPIGDEI